MSIQTDHHPDTEDATEELPLVTVFSKNDCPDCTRTKARFTARGVPFREINVQEDSEPRAEFGNRTPLDHVKERYGMRMPTVVVDYGTKEDHWSGPRPDKVVETGLLFERLGALVPAGSPAPVTAGR